MGALSHSLFIRLILPGATPRSRVNPTEIIVSLYALLFKRNGIRTYATKHLKVLARRSKMLRLQQRLVVVA